jgi:multidrug efflux pump subunit AcrA (membrane-fusion protein)
MYTVKIRLDDKDSLHYTGLMADVRASVNEPSASVYIPSKCIFSDDNGDYVYVVSGDQAAKMPVTKGRKKNAYMEITQGLTQGNEVILQSSQSLEDGMKVRVLTVK